jgi:hypothetical protein
VAGEVAATDNGTTSGVGPTDAVRRHAFVVVEQIAAFNPVWPLAARFHEECLGRGSLKVSLCYQVAITDFQTDLGLADSQTHGISRARTPSHFPSVDHLPIEKPSRMLSNKGVANNRTTFKTWRKSGMGRPCG